MLHVCFSTSAKGSLKCAGNIIGNKDTVVCIPDDLSVGDITDIPDFETRKRSMTEFCGAFYDSPREFDEYLDTVCRDAYREFYGRIFKHSEIMVWYSNSPYEFCGLLYVLWLLRDSPAKVRAVNCSRPIRKKDSIVFHHCSGDICPEDFSDFIPYIRSFTEEQKQAFAQRWAALVREQGQLRVFDGKTEPGTQLPYEELLKNYEEIGSRFAASGPDCIKTAELSYFDDSILNRISAVPARVAEVIAAALGNLAVTKNIRIGDGLIALRIKALTEQGVLKLEGQSKRFYENRVSLK
jgi:Protein of unknown function./Domain of unknown function (DUF1835).